MIRNRRVYAVAAGAAALVLTLSACNFTDLRVDEVLACSIKDKDSGQPLFDGVNGCGVVAGYANLSNTFGLNRSLFPGGPNTTTGAGTAADPRVITTLAGVADSGVKITQVDRFVDGSNTWDTSLTLSLPSFVPPSIKLTFRVFRVADCFLGRSDVGGSALTDTGAVCTGPGGARLTITDTSGGAARQAGSFDAIVGAAEVNASMNNTADPGQTDNGVGMSWVVTFSSDQPATVSSRFTYDGGSGFGS